MIADQVVATDRTCASIGKLSLGLFPLFFPGARVMRHDDSASVFPSATRRQFLNLTGGALASLALSPYLRAMGATDAQSSHPRSPIPFHLGLASYSLRNFDLDHAVAMTHRVGLDRICLKSMHLPLDSTPSQIAAASEKVKKAGLILYAGGVISMKNEGDIVQAFEYAKAAGMQTITAAPIPEVLPASTSTSRNMTSVSRSTTTALAIGTFRRPRASTTLSNRSITGSACASTSATPFASELTCWARSGVTETVCSICISRT